MTTLKLRCAPFGAAFNLLFEASRKTRRGAQARGRGTHPSLTLPVSEDGFRHNNPREVAPGPPPATPPTTLRKDLRLLCLIEWSVKRVKHAYALFDPGLTSISQASAQDGGSGSRSPADHQSLQPFILAKTKTSRLLEPVDSSIASLVPVLSGANVALPCCRWPGIVRLTQAEIAGSPSSRHHQFDFVQRFTRLADEQARGLVLTDNAKGECVFLEGRNDCAVQQVKPAAMPRFRIYLELSGIETLPPCSETGQRRGMTADRGCQAVRPRTGHHT